MRNKTLGFLVGLALAVMVACTRLFPSPVASPGAATVTPSPTPVRPVLRIFVPPAWRADTLAGRTLRQEMLAWAANRAWVVQVRTYAPEHMLRILESRDVAPGAMPALMLVPHAALPAFRDAVSDTRALGSPPEFYPFVQNLHPGWPWLARTWGLWVPRARLRQWQGMSWERWVFMPWGFPGGDASLEEVWQLYHVAGGGFPPRAESEQDRAALLRVFSLLETSKKRKSLPPQVLDWKPEEVRQHLPQGAWLLASTQAPWAQDRGFLFPADPQGQPGPLWAEVYLWIPAPDLHPDQARATRELLSYLYSPRLYAGFIEQGWLPVFPGDVQPAWAHDWDKATSRFSLFPVQDQDYTRALRAALLLLLREGLEPEAVVSSFFTRLP